MRNPEGESDHGPSIVRGRGPGKINWINRPPVPSFARAHAVTQERVMTNSFEIFTPPGLSPVQGLYSQCTSKPRHDRIGRRPALFWLFIDQFTARPRPSLNRWLRITDSLTGINGLP